MSIKRKKLTYYELEYDESGVVGNSNFFLKKKQINSFY